MRNIRKQTLYDDAKHPVAVQIPYADWLDIEARLRIGDVRGATEATLSKHAGVLRLPEDPLEYQRKIREEWP